MTDQSGPRHGDDSVYDPNPDTAYDEDYAIAPEAGAAGAGAAGAGAGAAGAGAAGGTGGPPLRGLAMVLTAVAVILIAWGIYAVVGGDDDETDTAGATQSESAGQDGASDADSDAASSPQDDADAGASDDAAASGTDGADGTEGADDAASGDDGDENTDGDDGADEPAAGEVDRAGTAVTVLNNSGEPVAQSTADRLRGEQWTNIGYGNLRGRIDGISEESRVYYPEGNAQAQAAAEQVAGDLGISAAAGNPDYYNRFGEADVRNGPKADGVVVVLTGPL